MKALLMLENGITFEGTGFGYEKDVLCEVVFNSAMCGYTELLTDPSYAGQGVVMTYPMIGNYGICLEDSESEHPWLSAFIIHDLSGIASNFRSNTDLDTYLKEHEIPGMFGIDTRALTRILRENGTMRGMISYGESFDIDDMKAKINSFKLESLVPMVSPKETKVQGEGKFKVALLDYGAKENIVRSLIKRGCTVKRFTHSATSEEILAYNPDGIMLSNGPGDPEDCTFEIAQIKKLYESKVPMFGICLGHQLMALSQGFSTYKLKYGHRGINHPVKDLSTNRVYISSQNHGYVVDEKSVDAKIAKVSFISMNDTSVEGLTYNSGKAFTVQFHPEASSGPLDTAFLFDQFIAMMEGK